MNICRVIGIARQGSNEQQALDLRVRSNPDAFVCCQESSNVVQAPSIPPQAAEAVQKATKAGSSNSGLVLGGLAAAAVLGIAVAVPKEKAAGKCPKHSLTDRRLPSICCKKSP